MVAGLNTFTMYTFSHLRTRIYFDISLNSALNDILMRTSDLIADFVIS